MTDWSVNLANSKDEKAIVTFLQKNEMDGPIKLGLERTPDFFKSLDIEGHEKQVIVIKNNDIHGLAICSWKKSYPENIVYLHSLKLSSSIRGSRALFLGFKKLKSLIKDNSIIYTTILSNNKTAIKVLTSKRVGLPNYIYQGEILSYMFKSLSESKSLQTNIRSIKSSDINNLITFWKDQAKNRSLMPEVNESHFLTYSGPLLGYQMKNILIAEKNGVIIASLAFRNVFNWKAWVVKGYSKSISILKPFINIYSALRGIPNLPNKGPITNTYMGAWYLSAEGLTPARHLLEKAREMIGEKSQLLLALHEDDPLNECCHQVPKRILKSKLYTIRWDDSSEKLQNPYLDTGTL